MISTVHPDSMPFTLNKNYKAILFDFDGVLGRTMEDNYNAWAHALAQQDISITHEQYYLLEGATTAQVAEHFLTAHDKSLDLISRVVEEKEKFYLEHNSFSLYAGAERLIDRLRMAHMRIGLVSGAGLGRLSATCGDKFFDMFDTVVTGDDVARGKPAPDPYLRAAEKLSVAPVECLAVENAPLGIRAAKAANMDCVAISSTLGKHHLGEADVIIDGLEQVCHVAACLEKACY